MMEFFKRIKFWNNADRLGPDIPTTYWKLFFPKKAKKLCKKKFKYFGEGAEFRPGAYAINCSKISIGSRVVLRPTTMLFGNGPIIIEDDVMLGSGVHIYTANHDFSNPNISIIDQGHSDSKKVILKRGCWLGANVIILPGVIIGYNSIVAAGSIVIKDVPDYSLVAGNPAIVIRSLR